MIAMMMRWRGDIFILFFSFLIFSMMPREQRVMRISQRAAEPTAFSAPELLEEQQFPPGCFLGRSKVVLCIPAAAQPTSIT